MAVSDIEVDKCAIRNTCERRNEADIQNVKVWKITITFFCTANPLIANEKQNVKAWNITSAYF